MTTNGHAPVVPGDDDPAEGRRIRAMNHREWLMQFSMVLAIAPKGGRAPEMTPFRAGAISRLKMAARYIELLEHDLDQATKRMTELADKLDASPDER